MSLVVRGNSQRILIRTLREVGKVNRTKNTLEVHDFSSVALSFHHSYPRATRDSLGPGIYSSLTNRHFAASARFILLKKKRQNKHDRGAYR